MQERADILVIGAGAAGLMAGIFAARTAQLHAPATPPRVLLVDSAKTLGAKILVAGGGRCNVTHHAVDESAYAGSSRNAIRKVLLRFTVDDTVAFFQSLGVELKREDTGKLFPVTDRARSVLDALLHAAHDAGCQLLHPFRIETLEHHPDGTFHAAGPQGAVTARRAILATGGLSLPKSGSDGHGHALARALGHTITPRVFPALVPLLVEPRHFVTTLAGIAAPARVEVRSAAGRKLASFQGPVLCTHFGLSGPAILDASRHYIDARADDPAASLVIDWLPQLQPAELDTLLKDGGRSIAARHLRHHLPARLADALCASAGIDPLEPCASLTRERRKALVRAVHESSIPVAGDRGYLHAEVTAGGVPLREIRTETMESRPRPGLHLCGEILDVDGRIGGFNFQWAWASGFVAGSSAALALAQPPADTNQH